MRKVCGWSVFVLLSVALAARAAVLPGVSAGAVEAGVWNSGFRAVMARANELRAPLLVFYGDTECGASNVFVEKALHGASFAAWLNRHPVFLVYMHGGEEEMNSVFAQSEDRSAHPDYWAANAWFKSVVPRMYQYPFVGLHWKKPDGSSVDLAFVGRNGMMPRVSGVSGLEDTLVALLEQNFGSYDGNDQPASPPSEPSGIVALSTIGPYEAVTLNSRVYSARTFTVPVSGDVEGGRAVMGQVAVKQTAKNKLTVKYERVGGKTVSLSGAWDCIDLSNGSVTATLSKSGVTLSLELSAAGVLSVTDGACGFAGSASETVKSSGGYQAFAGLYCAAFCDSQTREGAGYLTVSVLKSGKATWKGVFADGLSVGGTSQLSLNPDGSALMPVYRVSSKYSLTAALRIEPNAVWGHADAPSSVTCAEGFYVRYVAGARKDAEDWLLTVFGGPFEKNVALGQLCKLFGYPSEYEMVIGDVVRETIQAGSTKFVPASRDVITSLAYSTSTGVFSGKAVVPVGAKKVAGSFCGVIHPGWGEAGVFGTGVFYSKGLALPVAIVSR